MVVQPGLSFDVTLKGRRVRKWTISAANIKMFQARPEHLRHDFEDEFAHFVWGADLGLAEVSIAAKPLYTLTDRKPTRVGGDTWNWEYRGRHQDGAESHLLSKDGVKDSFTPLQLDVFHALWETLKGAGCRP